MRKGMHPTKDYDVLRQRWQEAFGYSFVCQAYNFTMPELTEAISLLIRFGADFRQPDRGRINLP